MDNQFIVTYYHHSGFTVEIGGRLLIFDYWRGEHGEVAPEQEITLDYLDQFKQVYVFVSHEHPDHFDEVIYTWRKKLAVEPIYIVSYDMPVATRGKQIAPGKTLSFPDGLTVKAFDSTDLGVSFLVQVDGVNIFHAGDLNFWHWREESTIREIEEAEQEFYQAVEPICKETIDVAFFPVDPRQGPQYDAGANHFIASVKPQLLIPMHFWGRIDLAKEFARQCRCAETEILPLCRVGESLVITKEEGGYMTVAVQTPYRAPETSETADGEEPLDVDYEGNGVFSDTDLPVALNVENEKES